MSERDQVEYEGGKLLRCEVCGEPIGLQFGELTPAMREALTTRCYACAVVGEAEQVLTDAGPYWGNEGPGPSA